MKLAVVGATGLVGQEILKVLEERSFPFNELYLVASARSVGQPVTFKGKEYKIKSIEEAVKLAPDIAIFSAGGGTSLEWAPKFAEAGTIVIDNSSAWRMDPTKKLVVPEINGHVLTTILFNLYFTCRGANARTIWIVEQFGFAMMRSSMVST